MDYKTDLWCEGIDELNEEQLKQEILSCYARYLEADREFTWLEARLTYAGKRYKQQFREVKF